MFYSPKYHPEQRTVHETDTEFAFTGYDGSENFLGLHYTDQDSTPHWTTADGIARAEFQYCKDKWLAIKVSEIQKGKQSGKEAWITLPKEVVDALRTILNGKLPE